jgi:hypothetical protein
MRIVCLIVLIMAIFTWADEAPPFPRVMHIFMKDSTVDTILCSLLDTTAGITFDRVNMYVGIQDTVKPMPDPSNPVFDRHTHTYCLCIIDSIAIRAVGGVEPAPPTPEPAPQPAPDVTPAPQPATEVTPPTPPPAPNPDEAVAPATGKITASKRKVGYSKVTTNPLSTNGKRY